MRVDVELSKTSIVLAVFGRCVPKPNVRNFSRLFQRWELTTTQLKTLSVHILFCNTDVRGEYMGCHNGIHHVELRDLYCAPSLPKNFLEEVTIHELRHVWWALQDNSPPGLGEDDCQKEEKKKRKTTLWIFENSPTT